jgi:hypothetical protein
MAGRVQIQIQIQGETETLPGQRGQSGSRTAHGAPRYRAKSDRRGSPAGRNAPRGAAGMGDGQDDSVDSRMSGTRGISGAGLAVCQQHGAAQPRLDRVAACTSQGWRCFTMSFLHEACTEQGWSPRRQRRSGHGQAATAAGPGFSGAAWALGAVPDFLKFRTTATRLSLYTSAQH